MKNGIERIAAERQRQIDQEGYSPTHDHQHDGGELSEAAACYAELAGSQIRGASVEELRDKYLEGWGDLDWPWSAASFKPHPAALRNLEKAGALIAAEIDRILNLNAIGRPR